MNRLAKIGVWVLLAIVLLLPLYELADYTEVWPHDGDLTASGLFFLFSGMALLAGRKLRSAFVLIVLTLITIPDLLPRRIAAHPAEPSVSLSPPRFFCSIAFCDLRI
jgi:hypothetical protein